MYVHTLQELNPLACFLLVNQLSNPYTLDYLNLILNSIGIEEAREQLLINGALMGYNIGTAVAAGFLVGKLRRRTTFVTGLSWMLICYICWTALSAVNQQRNFEQESLGRGVLAFIFLYYVGYNFALNALPNLVRNFRLFSAGPLLTVMQYLSEVLPFYLRAKGTTIYQCWQGVVLTYNGFVNPVAMDAISWRYYIVFCCLLAFELTVIYFTFPEVRLTHTLFLCSTGSCNYLDHSLTHDSTDVRHDPRRDLPGLR
jgi:MFS family permease